MPSSSRLHLSGALRRGRQASRITAEDLAQMRITGTVEYLAGAVVFLSVLGLPDPDRSDHGAYLSLALAGLALALLRFWAPRQLWVPRASILIGLLYVGAVVALSRPVGPTPFFFLWPMLTTAYFLGRRDLVVASVVFTVVLFGALALNPGSAVDLQWFNASWSVILIVSLLVLALRERVDRLVEDLDRTASTDTLTGLANRRTFAVAFDRALGQARAKGTPLALAIFDLDHFKQINDRLGHAEGDRALQRFAAFLRDEARPGDIVARIGGEEFAILLPASDAEDAHLVCEGLIGRLVETTRLDPAPLSVSVGVTEVSSPGDTADLLLLAADRALYEAKHRGRGRCVVARQAAPHRLDHTGTRLELSTDGDAGRQAHAA